MAEPFQLLKKSQPKHSYALLLVYALRLFVYRLRLRSAPLYEWVEIWYVGSLWPSQAVFTIQFNIIQVKVISGHPVKKVNPLKTNRDMALQYMFVGQLFAKNTKNDPKTLFEISKSVKK